jgi:hypothetical protein
LHHVGALIFFVVLAVIATSYTLFAFSRGNDVTVKPSAVPRAPLPPNRVELVVEPIELDPLSGTGEVEVIPKLVGDVGVPYGNTSQASVPMRLTIDGATPSTEDVPAGEVLAITRPTILLGNSASIDSFPFDSYNTHLFASAERTSGPSPTPIPVVFVPFPEGVSGYDAVFSGVSTGQGSGSGQNAQMVMDFTRDDDAIAVTIFVGIISVVSAAVVLFVAAAVALGRMDRKLGRTVVMATAATFSLIALRQVIPDAPHVGVDYDIFAYYSTVIAAFLSFIVCVIRWLSSPEAT